MHVNASLSKIMIVSTGLTNLEQRKVILLVRKETVKKIPYLSVGTFIDRATK